jgi:hypothetical protein
MPSLIEDILWPLFPCAGCVLLTDACGWFAWPAALQIESGDWRYDARKSMLVWEMDLIDQTNKSGAMEFVVPATDAGSFFPIEVRRSGRAMPHLVGVPLSDAGS